MNEAENQILLDLYKYYITQVAEKIVLRLQQLTGEEFLLAGDDSGLKSVWEEVCVQLQGEESIYWEAYKDTIDSHIKNEFSYLPDEIQAVLNYVASMDEGEDVDFEDSINLLCIEAIREEVLEKAEDFSNLNISKYLDNDFDEEEEEEDEDDESEKDNSK